LISDFRTSSELGRVCSVENYKGRTRTRKDCLSTLFRALDANDIRYCVLHSWDELPEKLSSDLDIAVHPEDRGKLPLVFRCMDENDYKLVQVFNYFVHAFYFVFCWCEESEVIWLALDIIFEHRRGGLIISSGKALVCGRSRRDMFWIPAPKVEFRYLLSKKLWKGACPERQATRIKSLAESLGAAEAEAIVANILVGRSKNDVMDGCIRGNFAGTLAKVKHHTWITSLVRNPIKLGYYLISDLIRRICRWRMPTGIVIVVSGPDGAGKSTLIQHLLRVLVPAFRRSKVFHWRPMLLWKRSSTRDTTRPHSDPVHGLLWSVLRLFAYVLDYFFGYWTVVRPLIARSGLVVFDRYFDDMAIDPKRYRYGGPPWLAKALRPFVPAPDITLVLDADEDILLSRKQELPRAELSRQRQLYRVHRSGSSVVHIINASAPIDEVQKQSVHAILGYLNQRFENRYSSWYQPINS